MWTTLIVIGGTALGLFILRKIREYQWGHCSSKRLLNGKVVIITGANSGLGKETAKDLAERGAHVVLACRNRLSAEKAINDIKELIGGGKLTFIELDLSSLSSVRECALNILEKFSHIDVLINNAGISIQPELERRTEDGYEIHFGVNYLGHFLLTHLLLDRLVETKNSRIVIVSSMLYRNGEVNFDKLTDIIDPNVKYSGIRNPLYCNSKLENLLHAERLTSFLKGSNVGVHCLCPGFVKTELMRHYLGEFGLLKKICFLPVAFFFMRGVNKGAQTTIYCAVAEELDKVESGFYRNCRSAQLLPKAKDKIIAKKLFEESMKLISRYI